MSYVPSAAVPAPYNVDPYAPFPLIPAGPGVPLAVQMFSVPEQLPDLNSLLATGRWDILHVTDTTIMIKRLVPDPDSNEGAYTGEGTPVVERATTAAERNHPEESTA